MCQSKNGIKMEIQQTMCFYPTHRTNDWEKIEKQTSREASERNNDGISTSMRL